jgi:hypothetical protein
MNLQILIDKEKTILSKNTLLSMDGDGATGGKISNDADNRVNFLLCPHVFGVPHAFLPKCLEQWQLLNILLLLQSVRHVL